MKGLPFKATVDDVVKFYSGFSVEAGSVYLKRHADGRLNGEVRTSARLLCATALHGGGQLVLCVCVAC